MAGGGATDTTGDFPDGVRILALEGGGDEPPHAFR
jgi:hypothetical protein